MDPVSPGLQPGLYHSWQKTMKVGRVIGAMRIHTVHTTNYAITGVVLVIGGSLDLETSGY